MLSTALLIRSFSNVQKANTTDHSYRSVLMPRIDSFNPRHRPSNSLFNPPLRAAQSTRIDQSILQRKGRHFVTFPERLITLRLESGLSQHQLADELNTNQSKIKRFELGLQEPKLSELQQISEIFKISISELLQNVEARTVKKGGISA